MAVTSWAVGMPSSNLYVNNTTNPVTLSVGRRPSGKPATPKQKAARWHNWLIRCLVRDRNNLKRLLVEPSVTSESRQIAKQIDLLYEELLFSMKQRQQTHF